MRTNASNDIGNGSRREWQKVAASMLCHAFSKFDDHHIQYPQDRNLYQIDLDIFWNHQQILKFHDSQEEFSFEISI